MYVSEWLGSLVLKLGCNALLQLAEVASGFSGFSPSKEALEYTAHAKRKTVKAEDIRMVMKRIMKS